MSTDNEKARLAKLLEDLEIPDIKLSERCADLVNDFHQKHDKEVEEEEQKNNMDLNEDLPKENPYIVDKQLIEENEKKLKILQVNSKRTIKQLNAGVAAPVLDPKRPWRTHSIKERLLRINNELKYHQDKGGQSVAPLEQVTMRDLVRECQEEAKSAPSVCPATLREAVDNARKCLPNFQYRKVDNSTATAILTTAHEPTDNLVATPVEFIPLA